MSKEKKKEELIDILAMLDDAEFNFKPSRSLSDVLFLLYFLEKREEKLKRELAEAYASMQNDEIRKILAEKMLKTFDKFDETLDTVTTLMSAFALSFTPKLKSKKSINVNIVK